jgi:hypothetical protein
MTGSGPLTRDGSLLQDSITLDDWPLILPIRHHSPACAYHVRQVIQQVRPTDVLIEGPADANHLLDVLLDPQTVPPVAIFAYTRSGSSKSAVKTDPSLSASLFYPFCEYSPEYVALRTAREVGAAASFIDLPSWGMAEPARPQAPKINGYADRELSHHRFITALCKRTRTRSFDELWDSLFESTSCQEPSSDFFSKVGTYGLLARENASGSAPSDEHNDRREAVMAGAIRQAEERGGRVVVVVGAFHRAGLLKQLAHPKKSTLPSPPKEHGIYVTLYGYEQLDRWNGYESGMPAPEFFHRVWKSFEQPIRESVTSHLARLATAFRRQQESISTAHLISAVSHLEGLCRLRGHERPTLDDVRDSVRSAWLKSPQEGEGGPLLTLLNKELVGSRVGQVAESAGRPPIVEDFYRSLKELGFIGSKGVRELAQPKEVTLSIYREGRHRHKSAFLHRLVELGSAFARRIKGPDFVQNVDVDRAQETWQLHWKPMVESSIMEASPLGATILEAATQHLLQRFSEKANPDARFAVEQLTSALVMNLGEWTDSLWEVVDQALTREASFSAACSGLAGLIHLKRYRTILEADRVSGLAGLIGRAFHRAIWLLDTLPGLPPSDPQAPLGKGPADDAVDSLILLRHAALAPGEDSIDPSLFVESLVTLVDRLNDQPLLEGAVLGILRRWDRVEEEDLRRSMSDRAKPTSPPAALGDWVRGLIAVRRHALIEDTSLLPILHEQISQGSEEAFRHGLPHWRLAFARLSPGELQRLAEHVDRLALSSDSPPPTVPIDRAPGEQIDRQVAEVLQELGW